MPDSSTREHRALPHEHNVIASKSAESTAARVTASATAVKGIHLTTR